jgi:hypothetical protein
MRLSFSATREKRRPQNQPRSNAMDTKFEFESAEVQSVEAVAETAPISMSLTDLDMVAGGAVIATFY